MNRISLLDNRITLINGDCLEILPKVRPACVDMVFADLPYGTTACKWDVIIPFTDLWPKLQRCGKDRIAYVFTAREPFTSLLVTSNIKQYHHKWVWNKKQSGSFQNAKYMPLQIEEDVIVFGDRPRYYPQMRTGKMRKRGGAKAASRVTAGLTDGFENYSDQYYPTNIIDLANPRNGVVHPTQKPVELLEYLIKTYTNENDVVLDPTAGSFTTAVACINTNRRCIAIEKDADYFRIGVKRCEEAINARQ